MRLERLGFKLRMKLTPKKPGVIGKFHDLSEVLVRGVSGKLQTVAGENFFILAVKLIAVAMTLRNFPLSINLVSQRILLENTWISAQAHRSSHFFNSQQFTQFINDPV